MKSEQVIRRLKSVEGHVRGVTRMVEEGAYCIDVVHQITAVRSALAKVTKMILDHHLHHCVSNALRGDDPDRREQVIQEMLDVFESHDRVGGKRGKK